MSDIQDSAMKENSQSAPVFKDKNSTEIQTDTGTQLQAGGLSFEEKENTAWETVARFDKASGETLKKKASRYRDDYDSMNLAQLADALRDDTNSKSALFKNMSDSVYQLFLLAASRGKVKEKDGLVYSVDFALSIARAKEATHSYLSTRQRDYFRIRDNGKRRIDIAQRIELLLEELTSVVDTRIEKLTEKEKRRAEYTVQKLSEDEITRREALYELDDKALDAENVIRTGQFGPEIDEDKRENTEDEWIAGNFTDALQELLQNPREIRGKKEKNIFLSKLVDKNNLLMANKMALLLTIDEEKKFRDMRWLKDRVCAYMDRNITHEEYLTLPPEEIAKKGRALIEEYKEIHKDWFKQIDDCLNEILELLPVEDKADRNGMLSSICSWPQLEELLSEDSDYTDKLNDIRQKVKDDDALLREELSKRFSSATIGPILRKMNETMVGLRIFGKSEEILRRAGIFWDQLIYIAPRELRAERNIEKAMESQGIPKDMKDILIGIITGNSPEKLIDMSANEISKLTKKISEKTFKPNKKWYTGFVEKKMNEHGAARLTVEAWQKLDDYLLHSLEYEPEEFKGLVLDTALLGTKAKEGRVTREEYDTRRRFEEENKSERRKEHLEKETKRVEELGNSMEDKFLLIISGNNDLISDRYLKSEDIYRGCENFRSAVLYEKNAATKGIVLRRRQEIYKLLQMANVSKERCFEILDRFTPLIEGILQTDSELLFDDQRMEGTRINLETFGVGSWEEALSKIGEFLPAILGKEENQRLSSANKRYEDSLNVLKRAGNGRLKEIAPILGSIPKVYLAMVNDDPKVLEDLVNEVILPRFEPVIQGGEIYGKNNFHAVPLLCRYVFSNLTDIYNGTLKLTADGYASGIRDYRNRLYDARINGNLKDVQKVVSAYITEKNHIGKKEKLTSQEQLLISAVLGRLQLEAEDEEGFETLLSKKKAVRKAKEHLLAHIDSLDTEVTFDQSNIKKSDDSDVKGRNDVLDKRKEIADKKKAGRLERARYMGLDGKSIGNVRKGKSLVRIAVKGGKTATRDKGRKNRLRGAYMENIDFLLPDVLRDAVIEKGSFNSDMEAWLFRKKDRNDPMDSPMYRHAYRMHRLHDYLTRQSLEGEGLSQEEASMYILRLYNDPDRQELFEAKTEPSYEAIRKSDDFKLFRENYALLKELESTEAGEPGIEKEKASMSRDLRILLITREGLLDQKGVTVDFSRLKTESDRKAFHRSVGKLIKKQKAYLEHSIKLLKVIRDAQSKFRDHKKENARSPFYKDAEAEALREYFLGDSVKELETTGGFDENAWKERLNEIFPDTLEVTGVKKLFLDNLVFAKDSISAKDLSKAETSRIDTKVSEKDLSDIIRLSASFFHGKENIYEKLDEDQKKFFAIALMVMEKSALGDDTLGTDALLYAKEDRTAFNNEVTKQLQNYVEGKPYHLDIDYSEVIYKLTNYDSNTHILSGNVVISNTAFEKAVLFARDIYSKRLSYVQGEKDTERLGDGISSIEAAFFVSGKRQKNEVDKLKGADLEPEDVVIRLLNAARRDQISKKKMIAGGAVSVAGAGVAAAGFILNAKANEQVGKELIGSGIGTAGEGAIVAGTSIANKSNAKYRKMSYIIKKLEEYSENRESLALFLRVMQNRTILDKGTGGSTYANEAERNALLEALSGDADVAAMALSGFMDADSCRKAMISAMSFQLRDDKFFKGRVIGKTDFAKGALDRKTTMDWDLIERAMEFVEEIRERRARIYATSHAKDFIRQTGNRKAIKELDYLEKNYSKDKERFDIKAFEERIVDHVDETTSGVVFKDYVNDSINRAWAGYTSLSREQKNLFFKVLARRDLLDVAKANYTSNFFGVNERDFLNPSGRNELINEYVRTSLNGGSGVAIDKDTYYEAMRSLLSTQVSDRVSDFRNRKELSGKLSGIFSFERGLILQRNTAIDWKLFKRALNFVERATAELHAQEGNALLYQGAGDLVQYGTITVDYSFLRKNFHRVGNQWTRYIGRRFLKQADKQLKLTDTLNTISSAVGSVTDVFSTLGVKKDGIIGQGLGWVKTTTSSVSSYAKKAVKGTQDGFVAVGVRTKKEQEWRDKKEEDKEAEKKKALYLENQRRNELELFDRMKEGFDNIIAEEMEIEHAVKAMKDVMVKELYAYSQMDTREIKAGDLKDPKAEKNLIDQHVKKGASIEKGDIRDTLHNAQKKYKDINGIINALGSVPFIKNLKALMTYGTERLVYGSILNGKIIGNDAVFKDENGNDLDLSREEEIKKLKENAARYASQKLSALSKAVFGEELSKNILSVEQTVYDNKASIDKGVMYLMRGFNYGRSCMHHVMSINNSIRNMSDLKDGKKDAKAQRDKDRKALEEALKDKRLNKEQYEKAAASHSANQALGGMSGTIADAMQKYNIASDVINFAIETVDTLGGKFNYGMKAASIAIQEGLEFAMFAIRVCTDRKALQDYFFTTDDGLKTVNRLIKGFDSTGSMYRVMEGKQKAKANGEALKLLTEDYSFVNQAKHPNALDIIADAQGYEHTSELVENVGMKMAQSIVFCASNFNPLLETKLMAVTVMTVMGLGADEIGKTTPDVTQKLFTAFKMSR